jgi:hypothetical protein
MPSELVPLLKAESGTWEVLCSDIGRGRETSLRAIAQAVSRRIPATAARVRA